MIENTSHYTDFLIKHKMSPNQFLLCWFLYRSDREVDKKGLYKIANESASSMANYYKYINQGFKWTTREVDDLVDRGFIEFPNRAGDYQLDVAQVTDKFTKDLVTNFKEFWETYPAFIQNFHHPSGPKVKLKAATYDEVEKLYDKVVKTKKKHQQIMDLLRWAIENNQITMNIKNFVGGRNWETLQELRDGNPRKKSNVTSF